MDLRDKLKFWIALNSFVEMIVSGVSPLYLDKAKQDGLMYLKALGGTEITPKVYFDSVTANGGCEQRNLPAEYTQVEYIESTGTQYIDTGVVPKTTLSIKIKYNILQLASSNNIAIFGSISSQTGLFSGVAGSPSVYYINTGATSLSDIPFAFNTIREEEYINDTMIRDGVTYTTNPIVVNDIPMSLFGRNTGSEIARIGTLRIYYFTLYDNGVLIQNLIPAKRNSDNVLGMYDTVSGTFLTNAGTGTFIAGPNAVPTPDNPMDIYCNNGALKVRHQSGLPLGYTLLDYIESTGTQYIDTGIKPNSNTAISIKYYPATSSVFMCLYGIQDSTSLNRFYGLISSTQFRIQINSNAGQTPNFWGINNDGTLITNTNGTFAQTQGIVTLGVDNKNKVISIKSDEYTGNISASDTVLGDNLDCQYNLLLLSRSTAGTAGNNFSGRLYSFTVKDNDMIIQNLIPAKRNSDNVVGMYDTVSGTFFTNAGTGDFVAGNVVNDLEPYVDLVPAGKNLFDSSMFNIEVGDTITYTYHQIPNGTYTMSTDFPPQTGQVYTNVWIMAGRQTSGQSSTTNGVSLGNPKTINVTDGWYTVAYRSSIPAIPQNPKDYNWQLEKGSTATDYEPYSAKRKVETIQITGKNLFDNTSYDDYYYLLAATGQLAHDNNPSGGAMYCSTDYIPVKPNTTYFKSGNFGAGVQSYYDADKNYISHESKQNTTFTTPANCKYVKCNLLRTNTPWDTAQLEQGSTATAYESYFDGGSAIVENLFGLDTYKDTQEVLSGNVTRNVGVKVLDGTEGWTYNNSAFLMDLVDRLPQKHFMFCTHFNYDNGSSTVIPNLCIGGAGATNTIFIKYQTYNTAEQFKQFLAAQYTNGTPVIIIYPLATPTTESVSPQPLTYIDNYVLTIEDASISNPIVNAINSTHTVPTPDYPLDINCNNGVLKLTTGFDINRLYKTGNPSVSNEGIYTTNSSQSYVRTQNDVNFSTANSWSFKWKFTYKGANTDQGIMSGEGKPNVQAIINSAGKPRFSIGDNTDWQVIWNDSSITFAYQEDVEYENEIYFNGTRYGYKVNGVEIGGVDSTAIAANTYFALGVERQRTSTQYTRCIWDLSKTSLIVDGVEQFPWLKAVVYADSKSKNLFDKNSINTVLGTILGTGDFQDATNRARSEYIPVEPLKTYTLSVDNSNIQVVPYFYDGNKSFLSFISGWKIQPYTFTTPEGCSYLCILYKDATTEALQLSNIKNVQLEEGSIATEYEPYWNTTETINVHGKNLFDISTSILGGLSSTDGSETVSTARARTDFVGINTPKITVTIDANDNFGIVNSYYYDENKNYIGNVGPASGNGAIRKETFTVPNGSKYVRVTFCIYNSPSSGINIDIFKQSKIQIESGSTATPYEPYFNGGTATAEMMLKVGNYQDVQSILDGVVTRNVGVKVFDGTESWVESGQNVLIRNATANWGAIAGLGGFCTHLTLLKSGETTFAGACRFATDFNVYDYKTAFGVNDITRLKQYLADQHAAGTPVIIVYPLATPTTESVSGQALQITEGDNIAEITQASLDNLELEAKYKKKA